MRKANPLWNYSPWNEDMNRFSNWWNRLDKRAVVAYITGVGIVGGGFITGQPDEWPLIIKPYWVTLNAGFLALSEYYAHLQKDKANSHIATLIERLQKHEPDFKGLE